jgi:hypothetical protein
MKYSDGTEAHVGDTVKFSDGTYGMVMCVMDTNEYTSEFPCEEWSYLQRGAMIKSESMGLIHYEQFDEEIEFVERTSSI